MNAVLNGLEVWFACEGNADAPPLVLIHGFPFSHEMWHPQVTAFSETYWVIEYDLRGHGRSSAGDGQYPFEFFVDDLDDLLRRVEGTRDLGSPRPFFDPADERSHHGQRHIGF